MALCIDDALLAEGYDAFAAPVQQAVQSAVLGVLDGEGRLVHWTLHGRGPVGGGAFGRLEPVSQEPPDAAQLTSAAETAASQAVDGSLEAALVASGLSAREAGAVLQALLFDPVAALPVSGAGAVVQDVVGAALSAAAAQGGVVVADRAGVETYDRSVVVLEGVLLDAMVSVGVERADKYAPEAAVVLAGEAARAVAAVVSEALDTSGQPLVRRYYVADHLGSVRAVVDTTGAVVEARDYAPWGLVMPGRVYVQGSETREGFTGHELDQETGHYYAGARYYVPSLGRWTSVDPLADQFHAWSPYNYVMNSPVGLVDPDGRAPCDPPDASCPPTGFLDKLLGSFSLGKNYHENSIASFANQVNDATNDILMEAGRNATQSVADAANLVSDAAAVGEAGAVALALPTMGASLPAAGIFQGVQTGADFTSLAAQTTNAFVFGGDGEPMQQAGFMILNAATVGPVRKAGEAALQSRMVPTSPAVRGPRYQRPAGSPQGGQFLSNRDVIRITVQTRSPALLIGLANSLVIR